MTAGSFARDTAVEPLGNGCFGAVLTSGSSLVDIHGGYSAAVVARLPVAGSNLRCVPASRWPGGSASPRGESNS